MQTNAEPRRKQWTRDSVIRELSAHGVKRNSGDYRDYEQAKKIMFNGKWHYDFDMIIVWIIKYYGVALGPMRKRRR